MTTNPLGAVTGAEGFIGSHPTETLVAAGFRVRAMAQYNSFSSYGWLETLSPKTLDQVETVLGDVRDPGSVYQLAEDVEAVHHLAALIAIPYSYRAPHSYVDANVTGTLNVLEAMRKLGIPRLVHTPPARRTAPRRPCRPPRTIPSTPSPRTPLRRRAETGWPTATTPASALGWSPCARSTPSGRASRCGRSYRPSSARSRRASGSSRPGICAPTRDFLYVKDTARAFLAVGTAPAEDVVGHTFNAGTGCEISIGELARLIGKLMDVDLEVREDEERIRPAPK